MNIPLHQLSNMYKSYKDPFSFWSKIKLGIHTLIFAILIRSGWIAYAKTDCSFLLKETFKIQSLKHHRTVHASSHDPLKFRSYWIEKLMIVGTLLRLNLIFCLRIHIHILRCSEFRVPTLTYIRSSEIFKLTNFCGPGSHEKFQQEDLQYFQKHFNTSNTSLFFLLLARGMFYLPPRFYSFGG